jgi:hypothetical protein
MPRTEDKPTPAVREATLDDALDDSFPASDPLAFTPQRAGQKDKKAPITDADGPRGLRGMVNRAKDGLKH